MTKIRLRIMAVMLGMTVTLTACKGNSVTPDMELAQSSVETIAVPENVQVVGLGEASHGVKEYQEMKREVFQALVEKNGCRTFIIEGDFGSALKVDDYIHGGEGTAKEAAAQIGFRIYRTAQMEELIQWMRTYNETAEEGKDLHFYGMDMQWADNSKAYVFDILEQIDPDACAQHREALAFLNDDAMYDILPDAFEQGLTAAENLIREVDDAKGRITELFGSETFAYARECARSLYNCCDIRKSDSTYNAVRDCHMAEKVQWYIEHGDGSVLFINGHNRHIGKVNTTPYYDCLGKLLAAELGDNYFAIGTDAAATAFNSQTDDGFEERNVKNKNSLNALADEAEQNYYYIDFSSAAKDSQWNQIISDEQRITCLNVTAVTIMKSFYTTEIIPKNTFDGMVIFGQVSPTTLDL